MSPTEENKKKEKKIIEFLVISILLVIILDLQFFGMYGKTTFLFDNTGIWEGGYRATIGQKAFIDYYVPYGTLIFEVQAVFNHIFGSNLGSMALHAFFLSAILCVIFYFILRKEFGYLISLIFSLFFYISFAGVSFIPYYNLYAYFFFFLTLFLLYKYKDKDTLPNRVYIISAILGVLSFYSKQDIGALQIFFVLLYFLFNYRKDFKKILLSYFLFSTVLLLASYLVLSSSLGEFGYWFNVGQPPHSSRISNFLDPEKILTILESWKFYFFLVFSYFVIFNKNKPTKKIMSLFLVITGVSLMNSITSNPTRQIMIIGIPLMVFLIYLVLKNPLSDIIKKNRKFISVILILILLLAVNPFPTYGLITLNYINSGSEKISSGNYAVQNIVRIQEGCYKGFPLSGADYSDLMQVRNFIETHGTDFVSFTVFPFIYCDYHVEPLRKIPTWFHQDTSFFQENIPDIVNVILKRNPKIIMLQDTQNYNPNFWDIETLLLEKRYYKAGETNATSISMSPIHFLLRNDTIQNQNL